MGGLNKTFATFGLILSGGAFVGIVKGAIDSADAFGKLEIRQVLLLIHYRHM